MDISDIFKENLIVFIPHCKGSNAGRLTFDASRITPLALDACGNAPRQERVCESPIYFQDGSGIVTEFRPSQDNPFAAERAAIEANQTASRAAQEKNKENSRQNYATFVLQQADE